MAGLIMDNEGIAVAVIAALAALPYALLAFMDAQAGGIRDLALVRMLGDLNVVFFAAASVMTAAFLSALGLAMARRLLLTPWLGWMSLAVAALNAVSVWIGVTFSSYHGRGWTVVAFGAFLGFVVVVLATSVSLLIQEKRDTGARQSTTSALAS